ncbi:MAG: nucleoside hydrolase [Chloroflexi bacterium]|nr:nucleoside hydrolase [Chloroflexota bacterium]MCC6892810.1 nucleoside hydrolase [Anaerolineae bacterium]
MKRKWLFAALLCCLLGWLVVFPAAAQEPRAVIVDTDMTSDDFMALLYLFNNPDFSVKAITVTGTGFSFCDAGVEAALGLLALTAYGDVPVSCWQETPLLGGDSPVPAEWRTTVETVESWGLPEGGEPSTMNAVELFTATVNEAATPIEVLALGPLTNLAAAFNETPALVEKISHITIMGGAVDAPGSSVSEENTTAEWNIYCDPPAARIVFESGAPITLVALDATNDVPVTMDFLERLNAVKSTPESEFVSMLLTNNSGSIEAGGYSFWDQLATVVMADPDLVTHTEREVTVIDREGAEYGRTKPVGNGPTIDVVTKPDVATFEQHLIDTWNR